MALLGAVGYVLVHRPPGVVLNVMPAPPTPLPTPMPETVRCHVVGAVHAPGVYTLPSGALAQDAIEAAGGATEDADLERLNLAAPVQDHEQIIVPRRSSDLSPELPSRTGESNSQLVNINTADDEALQTLPGIGPTLAERIIEYRTAHGLFQTVDELIQVKGIGETKLEQLRPLITVEP